MKKLLLGLLCLLAAALPVPAESLTVDNLQPGTLLDRIGGDKLLSIIDITISGTLNENDFRVMRNMKLLNSINIRECEIKGISTDLDNVICEGWLKDIGFYQITLPEKLESMQTDALSGNMITELLLPTGMKSFDFTSVQDCKRLASISIEYAEEPLLMTGNPAIIPLSAVEIDRILSFENKDIYGKKLSIFNENTTITSAIMGEHITELQEGLFSNCSSLASISFKGDPISIGDEALRATAITSIEATNIISVGRYAFANTPLTDIDLSNVTFIGCYAFIETPIISIDISKANTIGNDAFSKCKKLTSVKFSPDLTEILHRLFEGCTSLTDIELPESITAIYDHAFFGCSKSNPKNLFPANTTYIGNGCFGEVNLDKVFVTKKLCDNGTFGSHAHMISPSIRQIEFEEGVTNISNNGAVLSTNFSGILILPSSLEQFYEYGTTYASFSKGTAIVCHAAVPPKATDRDFIPVTDNIVISTITAYVPDESVEVYRSTPYWKQLIVKPISEYYAGVEGITAADEEIAPIYFTLSGIMLKEKPEVPGIYIERRGTESRKIIVR